MKNDDYRLVIFVDGKQRASFDIDTIAMQTVVDSVMANMPIRKDDPRVITWKIYSGGIQVGTGLL